MRACSIIGSIKNLYGSVIKANCFIHTEISDRKPPRASTLHLKNAFHIQTICTPCCHYFVHWMEIEAQASAAFWCENVLRGSMKCFIVGGYKQQFSQDKESYLWEPTAMNRMSKFFALMLFNILFACFPSVSLIFSQEKEKAYDQGRNYQKYGKEYSIISHPKINFIIARKIRPLKPIQNWPKAPF